LAFNSQFNHLNNYSVWFTIPIPIIHIFIIDRPILLTIIKIHHYFFTVASVRATKDVNILDRKYIFVFGMKRPIKSNIFTIKIGMSIIYIYFQTKINDGIKYWSIEKDSLSLLKDRFCILP